MPKLISLLINSVNVSDPGPIWYYALMPRFVSFLNFVLQQVVFHFPYFVFQPSSRYFIRANDDDRYQFGPSIPAEERSKLIAEALKNALNLEIVYSPPGLWLPYDFVTISENPGLKSIRITSLRDGVGGPFLKALKSEANSRLQALVTFDDAQ
jgi:hypothetical protein